MEMYIYEIVYMEIAIFDVYFELFIDKYLCMHICVFMYMHIEEEAHRMIEYISSYDDPH
jgi:hypothetical protein